MRRRGKGAREREEGEEAYKERDGSTRQALGVFIQISFQVIPGRRPAGQVTRTTDVVLDIYSSSETESRDRVIAFKKGAYRGWFKVTRAIPCLHTLTAS